MKEIKKKIANSVITGIRKSVKDDMNSTASGWMFQPEIPKSTEVYKKNHK